MISTYQFQVRAFNTPPVTTPILESVVSVTVRAIPRDTLIGEWRLKSLLIVQLDRADGERLATTWLEDVAEYGTGRTEDEAMQDLVESLGEHLEVLEARESALGSSAQQELLALRKLIQPRTADDRAN